VKPNGKPKIAGSPNRKTKEKPNSDDHQDASRKDEQQVAAETAFFADGNKAKKPEPRTTRRRKETFPLVLTD